MKVKTIEKIVMSVYNWITELEYIVSVKSVSVNDGAEGYMTSVNAPTSTGMMKYISTNWAYSEDIIVRICDNEIDICRTLHEESKCIGYKHMFTTMIDKKTVSDVTAEFMFAMHETLKNCR